MDYAQASTDQVLQQLRSRSDGLEATEASRRLDQYGPNELRVLNKGRWVRHLLSPFSSAFVVVLIIAGIFSLVSGHRADAIIITIVVVINALIEWSQQFSAARILASLKKYGAKTVKVRRGGKPQDIAASQLVPGDIVLVGQGEKIVADGRLTQANDLSMDESSLTGESLPVSKQLAALPKAAPIYAQTNMVFSGTLVLNGRAEFCVSATGNATAFGQIAKLATGYETPAPIFQKIKKLTFRLVIATLTIGAAVVALGLWRGNGLEDMLRFAVALIVSVIPEGLPVTLTIILLLSVQQMAKRKAFVRNLPAVETLGMVTTITTDKTGTLTRGSLSIAEVWGPGQGLSAKDGVDLWLSVSHRHPDTNHPIERLITEYSEKHARGHGWTELGAQPFDTDLRFTLVAWQKGKSYRVYIKGAPETIMATCHFTGSSKKAAEGKLAELTGQGMRVIAIAQHRYHQAPADLRRLALTGWQFVGLVGFSDELRTEAAGAITTAKQAGIDVLMLTGDHLATAQSVGMQLQLITGPAQAAEGKLVAKLSEGRLLERLRQIKVFARVLPEHKFKLLSALKRTEITAMTGDGVNDAPALARADIGIAMGSGTDVAKEAADMVLLDDNFTTIVRAVKAGRRIYANVRKMIYYQLSTNLAEAGTVVIGLLAGWPLPLTAAQILWLNIVTDTTMIIPLGLEPAEPHLMRRPPYKPQESLLSNHLVSRLVVTVVSMAGVSILIFWLFLDKGLAVAQTMTFLSLCVVQWITALNARSEHDYTWQSFKRFNPTLAVGLMISFALVALVIFGPLQEYMGTVAISPDQAWYLLLPAVVTLLASNFHKWYVRRRK